MKELVKIVSAYAPLSFQDSGRLGLRNLGVASAGVMDPSAARLANLLVNNFADEVLLEFAFGGIVLEALEDTFIGVMGAGINRTVEIQAGERCTIGGSMDAVWGYISVHGGWDVSEVLGSRSFHERSHLGTSVGVGSVLRTLKENEKLVDKFVAKKTLRCLSPDRVIRVAKGPHASAFEEAKWLIDRGWKISNKMDRTGYRLEADHYEEHSLSVKSFPVVPGCIQLTPSGQPIVTMLDGPTVGGYPVIAIVHPADLSILAQRGITSDVRFEWYDID